MMCGQDFGSYGHGELEPCPRCGCTQRMNGKYRIEMRTITPGRTGRHKNLTESRLLRTVSTKTGHRVGEHRVIDRRRNRYYKRLVDTVTGEQLLLVDESLSDHRGRGTARRVEPGSERLEYWRSPGFVDGSRAVCVELMDLPLDGQQLQGRPKPLGGTVPIELPRYWGFPEAGATRLSWACHHSTSSSARHFTDFSMTAKEVAKTLRESPDPSRVPAAHRESSQRQGGQDHENHQDPRPRHRPGLWCRISRSVAV